MNGGSPYPSVPALLGAVRRTRMLRRMKQSHLAELLGVTQSSLSRWEGGKHTPPPAALDALARFVAAEPDEVSGRILTRLVEQSARPIHLVCDTTHRLIAASAARRAEWRLPGGGIGEPLWRYATPEIRRAEGRLEAFGWFERNDVAVFFDTSGRPGPHMWIRPSTVLWERVAVGSSNWARLVTTLDPVEALPDNAAPV